MKTAELDSIECASLCGIYLREFENYFNAQKCAHKGYPNGKPLDCRNAAAYRVEHRVYAVLSTQYCTLYAADTTAGTFKCDFQTLSHAFSYINHFACQDVKFRKISARLFHTPSDSLVGKCFG